MSEKKYVSLDGLSHYDALIKAKIDEGDSEIASHAESYTNTKISNMVGSSSVASQFVSHNTSTSAHSDIRESISDLTTKLNNFLDVDDTTSDQLSEVLTLIENNKGTLESLTTSKVNVSDIIDNLTTSSTSKVLSANQGVAIKGLISALQEELDNHAYSTSNDIDALKKLVGNTSVSDQINNAIETIPAQVQADWNQNDEMQLDYVKNRPFYSEYQNGTLLEPVTLTAAEEADGMGFLPSVLNLADGMQCTVTYNGTTYDCTAAEYNETDMSSFILGNQVVIDGDDTGEPFLVLAFSAETAEAMGVAGGVLPLDGSETFTISIIGINETVHPLPDKYLANARAQKKITLDLDNNNVNFPIEATAEMDTAELQAAISVIYKGTEHSVIIADRLEEEYEGVIYYIIKFLVIHESSNGSALLPGVTTCTWDSYNGVTVGVENTLGIPFTLENVNQTCVFVKLSNDANPNWRKITDTPLDGIVLKSAATSSTQNFLITMDDDGMLYSQKRTEGGTLTGEKMSISNNVDDVLSDTSTNPVQNKIVNAALNNKADIEHTHNQYALVNDVSDLQNKVGNVSVSEQISNAIANKSDIGHTHTILNGVTEINNPSGSVQVNADTVNLFGNKILLKGHPLSDYEAATKYYVDNTVSDAVTTSVNTLTGVINGKADAEHTHSQYAAASDVADLQTKVGDTSVSEQIDSALANFSSGKTLTEHLSEESMVLTSLQYGTTLPSPGTPGRIFFLKVSE